MQADVEALVLSGEFFNGKERLSSPDRSESSEDSGWHDDEIELSSEEQKYRDIGYDSDATREHAYKKPQDARTQQESIGMGPGRTGVKGVIRDRDEAVKMEQEKRQKGMEDLRERMEAGNLGGKTYLQEEREKAVRGEERFDDLIFKELERDLEKRDVFGAPRARFGYLREVGMKQYVKAVEQEVGGIWVVVHLYDPSLERCYLLDNLLARLAKDEPTTKFLRARASALGFTAANKQRSKPQSMRRPLRVFKEEDEIFDDDSDESEESEDDDDSRMDNEDVDLEMLPTLLVYRDGQLVHNWVRVDWVAGKDTVDELLRNHNIIQPSISIFAQDIDTEHPDSDDADFRESLNRVLQSSGGLYDD